MPGAASLTTIAGSSPLVLVAPHGGRRDPVRRPWAAGNLRVNDLHTAALTAELAARTDASAIINDEQDRNEVDLNRISEAHDAAPWFLEQLGDLLEAVLTRHGRATVLVVHGWNVVQPAVDLGLGRSPGEDPFVVGPAAAVSPAFAASAVRRLVETCGARGITATVGARYPARHRENLLQLLTRRYHDDPRPLVRRIAAEAERVDAVQLELGIVLRWPGRWRSQFLAACSESLPSLVAPCTESIGAAPAPATAASAPPTARRLEFTAPGLSGLVGLDAEGGGRLLLFPPGGGLALFTGERTGRAPSGHVGTLAVERRGERGLAVRFQGPILRFPDTTPFLDLETGLAAAHLVEADLGLDFIPDDGDAPQAPDGGEFGTVAGLVTLAGSAHPIVGHGFTEDGTRTSPWPRVRAMLRLGERDRLAITLGLESERVEGFLRRGDRRTSIRAARVTLGAGDSPFDPIALEIELGDGERLQVVARALHRLPVIRGRGTTPVRVEFATCRLVDDGGREEPAGWCEVGGH